MAQLISVRLYKSDHQPLGFRLQGGKDFGTPLVIQKVNGGSAAEGAGLLAGDALIRVNNTDVYNLRHNDAQDAIRAAGQHLELTVQRGGGTWRPTVAPTGTLPRPGQVGAVSPVTKTSLKASPQPSLAFGSGHNSVAKPFAYMNGSGDNNVKSIVNKQYNTPVGMYSDQTIAETLSAQTEVLAGGVLGVNFKKNEKSYDAEKSAVFKMLQEDSNDPEPEAIQSSIAPPMSGLRHVPAPVARPDAPVNNTGGLPPGQNICEECERLIIGVFVRIKDKNLHVECFKCATCGSSLKNQGYYNLNGKLYCDIHAKMVARQHPPAANLEPVTVLPGNKLPSGTYSSPLSSHTTPLPPLSTHNYSNGSSSLFSPSSTLSGPKPFGSTGSAYSPSLSPRSAPLSPATRPVPAPAPAPLAAHAPVPPPTPDNPTYYVKPEYKSAAEERLIRKMAKMALNGYEIGIQRKIKPGDHLQTMANQIQDTIVTKHPLNNENVHNQDEIIGMIVPEKQSNGILAVNNDSNNTKSLHYSPSYKKNIFDNKIKPNDNILSIGDKIKDTIVKKHPSNQTISEKATPLTDKPVSKKNQNVNMQDFAIENLSSTPLLSNKENTTNQNSAKENSNISAGVNSEEMELQKYLQDPSMRAQFLTTILNDQTIEKQRNDYSNTKNDIGKRYENGFGNTQSNIQTRTKGIEESKGIKNGYNVTLSNSEESKNNFNKTFKKVPPKKIEDEYLTRESPPKQGWEQDTQLLHDNSLYKTKNTVNGSGTNGHSYNGDHTNYNGSLLRTNGKGFNKKEESLNPEILADCKNESIVKMRKKPRDSSQDAGKRDSKLISRPKSTVTSLDFTDGTYPVCHIDNKAITGGPFITALGRIWCPDHFVCVNASCRRQLQDIGFVEENGQLYCEYCFEQFIAPACDKCHAKIKGDCLNAIGKHFHPECFNCVYCGKLFGNNPFFLEDGLPYCEADWNELFTTKCFACGFPVEAGDRWVEALNNNYHSQCFNCTMCKKNLEGQSFFAKGGRPFCKNHAR